MQFYWTISDRLGWRGVKEFNDKKRNYFAKYLYKQMYLTQLFTIHPFDRYKTLLT